MALLTGMRVRPKFRLRRSIALGALWGRSLGSGHFREPILIALPLSSPFRRGLETGSLDIIPNLVLGGRPSIATSLGGKPARGVEPRQVGRRSRPSLVPWFDVDLAPGPGGGRLWLLVLGNKLFDLLAGQSGFF